MATSDAKHQILRIIMQLIIIYLTLISKFDIEKIIKMLLMPLIAINIIKSILVVLYYLTFIIYLFQTD